MKFKLALVGLVSGLITVSVIASVEHTPVELSPIELEMQELTLGPAEHLITQVLEIHPFVLLANLLF